MRKIITLIICCSTLWAQAQQIDFVHLKLVIEPDTLKSEIRGEVDLIFKANSNVDSVYVHGVNMDYHQVLLNEKSANYQYDNKGLWLLADSLKEINKLSIKYTAHPRRGMFFIGWNDKTGLSRRQIWTQGQGIDNRHWVPHFDEQTDKLVTEIEVLFDSKYEVISNGFLVSKNKEGNQTRWHYKMSKPHSSYLMMLAIGKYEVKKTTSTTGVSLWQYYYPDRADDYEWYYRHNEEIFNFLEQKIGVPYPWQNYKQVPVQDFQHGAMENTTATIFGDFFLVDEFAFNDRNYTYVNAHELVHQWFGNLVTATGSDEHWLHEGFATYYQWLSEKNLYGQDFFDWERYKAAQMVFEASKIDTVPLGNGKAGSARFYQKGAWVLDMLKGELGKENFDRVMKHYLKTYAYEIVTTDSLNKSIKAVTDQDFSSFFHRWVKAAGEPIIHIKSSAAGKGNKLSARTDYLPFEKFSLPVEVVYASKKETKRISSFLKINSNGEGVLPIAGSLEGLKLKYWTVNPGMQVLARVNEEKPFEILKEQYASSSQLLDRYFAMKAADEVALDEKEKWLAEVVKNENEFFSIRAEALRQLTEAKSKDAEELLLLALKSKDVQLQKEAITLVEKPEDDLLTEVARLRRGDSYELREMAMHKSIAGGDYEWLKDDFWLEEPGFPDHNVAVTALLYRVAVYKDTTALKELKFLTSSGYEFLTRIAAMQALAALQHFDDELAAPYFDALFSLNRTLSRNARAHLRRLYKDAKSKMIIDQYIEMRAANWDDFEKRTANRTFGLNLE